MTPTLRTLAAVALLGLAAVTATEASAKPGFGGFGHHHHYGHWGHGPWSGGWGYGVGGLAVGFAPAYYGGCRIKKYVDDDGDVVIRKLCY